jgi:hypothetical protein
MDRFFFFHPSQQQETIDGWRHLQVASFSPSDADYTPLSTVLRNRKTVAGVEKDWLCV